jgi:hypothetical protein
MKLVGFKSDNGVELEEGQHIKIYDKRDSNKLLVDGYLEYLPSVFIINNNDGNKYLLYWYIREENYDEISNKDKYQIEVVR